MTGLICFTMEKGPMNLGLSFLQGVRNLISRVDSQTFYPGWYMGVAERLRSAVILRLRKALCSWW